MSKWQANQMERKVMDALRRVPLSGTGNPYFLRPYITAYQLAIDIERFEHGTAADLGYPLGGRGSGGRTMAWYVARELSRQIKRASEAGLEHDIEGAFISNHDVVDFRSRRPRAR
jgi:hypothetical protein